MKKSKQYAITVLLAQYNPDYKKLTATINSILIQKNVNYEIIICDDGSTEDCFSQTEAYFQERGFTDYKLVKLKQNGGTVKNMANGIKAASGQYVKLISPGDYLYDENTLSEIYRFMKKHHAQIAFGDVVKFENTKNTIIRHTERMPRDIKVYHKKAYPYQKILKNMLLYWDWIIGASLIYERLQFLQFIREIDGKVKYVEDLITFIAIAEGIKIFHFNRYVVWYEYGTGVSTSKNDFWAEQIAMDKDAIYELLYKRHPGNRVIKRAYLNNRYRRTKSRIKKVIMTILICPGKVWKLMTARVTAIYQKETAEVRDEMIKHYLGEGDKNVEIRR